MAFNFAKTKALTRRTVHKTLGVRAFYKDSTMEAPVELTARWHNKIVNMGDLDGEGYAEFIEGLDRVVFDATEARKFDVRPGGQIWFPDLGSGFGAAFGSPLGGSGIAPPKFNLRVRNPDDGPFEEVWEITRV